MLITAHKCHDPKSRQTLRHQAGHKEAANRETWHEAPNKEVSRQALTRASDTGDRPEGTRSGVGTGCLDIHWSGPTLKTVSFVKAVTLITLLCRLTAYGCESCK